MNMKKNLWLQLQLMEYGLKKKDGKNYKINLYVRGNTL